MAQAKTEAFSATHIQLSRIAKALSHPARIAILEFLLKTDSCMCGDIVQVLPLSQSTVSQHLKELKKAGLIRGTIDGPRVCYCIEEDTWAFAVNAFGKFWSQPRQSCAPGGNCC